MVQRRGLGLQRPQLALCKKSPRGISWCRLPGTIRPDTPFRKHRRSGELLGVRLLSHLQTMSLKSPIQPGRDRPSSLNTQRDPDHVALSLGSKSHTSTAGSWQLQGSCCLHPPYASHVQPSSQHPERFCQLLLAGEQQAPCAENYLRGSGIEGHPCTDAGPCSTPSCRSNTSRGGRQGDSTVLSWSEMHRASLFGPVTGRARWCLPHLLQHSCIEGFHHKLGDLPRPRRCHYRIRPNSKR
mmetsp:Transcript_123838/g.174630  ORF Transcript_123838/g.174630 Transcript_123838/m.174630 type:complete len:240 (+) Transcript_123838:206-925(+)